MQASKHKKWRRRRRSVSRGANFRRCGKFIGKVRERKPPLYIYIELSIEGGGRWPEMRARDASAASLAVSTWPVIPRDDDDDDAQWTRSCLHRGLALFSRAIKLIPRRETFPPLAKISDLSVIYRSNYNLLFLRETNRNVCTEILLWHARPILSFHRDGDVSFCLAIFPSFLGF